MRMSAEPTSPIHKQVMRRHQTSTQPHIMILIHQTSTQSHIMTLHQLYLKIQRVQTWGPECACRTSSQWLSKIFACKKCSKIMKYSGVRILKVLHCLLTAWIFMAATPFSHFISVTGSHDKGCSQQITVLFSVSSHQKYNSWDNIFSLP